MRYDLPDGQWVTLRDKLTWWDHAELQKKMRRWNPEAKAMLVDAQASLVASVEVLVEEWGVVGMDGEPVQPTRKGLQKISSKTGGALVDVMTRHINNEVMSDEDLSDASESSQ